MSQPAVNFPLISNRPLFPRSGACRFVLHALRRLGAVVGAQWLERCCPGDLASDLKVLLPVKPLMSLSRIQARSSVLKLGEYRACSAGLRRAQPQNIDNVSAASETQPLEMIRLPKNQKHPGSFFDQEVMSNKLLCQIRTHKSWFLGAHLWWCQFWTFLNNAVFWLTPPRPRWWNVKMMRNYKSEAQCCKAWLDICSLYYT